ncbi:hypothetical protein BDW_04900 [Bdellovibrio bacteriovorus W]|nr:hypothetical protein BDW_04900 [Bdellovibrio bacteriovorus W]
MNPVEIVKKTFEEIKPLSSEMQLERVRKIIDLRMSAQRKPASAPLSCKEGCSQCCSLPVDISPSEAAILAGLVRNDSDKINRLKTQRNSKSTWSNLNSQSRKCIFLNDRNLCSIYSDRPLLCRMMRVTTDPNFCSSLDPMIQKQIVYDREVFADLVFGEFKELQSHDLMANLVLQSLGL